MYQLEKMEWDYATRQMVFRAVARELEQYRDARRSVWKGYSSKRAEAEFVWKALRNYCPQLIHDRWQIRRKEGQKLPYFIKKYYDQLRDTRSRKKIYFPAETNYKEQYWDKKSKWLTECFRNILGTRGGKFYKSDVVIDPDFYDDPLITYKKESLKIVLPSDFLSWGKLGILIGCITKNKAAFVASQPPQKIDYETELRPFKPFIKSDADEFTFYQCGGDLLKVGGHQDGCAVIAVCPWTGFTAHVFWDRYVPRRELLVKIASRARSTCRKRKKAHTLTLFEEAA